MPGYIPTALHKFQHKPPSYTQDAPHPCNKPVYGKHIQFATQKSYTPKLNSAYTNRVQSINGTLLYYALAVYPTILPYINKISTFQYLPTQYTMAKYNQVMDYSSVHPYVTIRYHTSDMSLIMYIDTVYLILPASHIHISGHYYF